MAAVNASQLREGMEVYSGEGQSLGPIERMDRDSITVRGQQYEFTSIARTGANRVYLTRQVGASTGTGRGRAGDAGSEVVEAQGEIHVPEVEERLHVEKRQSEIGEVQVRKTVTQEQQTVPVDLMREEVRVEERDTEDRPATDADLRSAFDEGTIRVPLRGEEAVVTKEAVVTGEVVVDKERTTEHQDISGTVRRVRVEVEEHYQRERDGFRQHYAQGRGSSGKPPFEEAEHTYRSGFEAAHDERHAGKRFEDVEPELRRQYERSSSARAGSDPWERLIEEVREGYRRGGH
ncbi:MAG: hypothetical protein AVDCRST_MAG77-914 [uncultured Chloroflexi bacterium]|uniref:DUF2382 domain-containing protein n=1 Tax=uncultured Chloroflexota bacterium TaxID=166587 RepID=A0A6J4HNX4_9CHLR|nr:MAG: hypothetical protein AVDCRST_MAG77-914 [uncultured Chloroflexota bacterium]